MTQSIEFNIAKVRELIREAEKKYQRDPGSVSLIAVSKTRTAQEVRQAVLTGAPDIGENYVQEALGKQAQLGALQIRWHFIGPIQSNKTQAIASSFDWVHSVDRVKIARRLSDQRPAGKPPLNICLQVNISGEESKAGLEPQEVAAVADQVSTLPGICLRGLMAIPRPADSFEQQREPFGRMRELLESLRIDHPRLDTLSMGMSDDMEAAIAEGATMVRIGTAIFGQRR